jgi:hypothetical protein
VNLRYLSKSRILSGLQCPKRLYLEVNQPNLAQVEARTERTFAIGHQVGEVAQLLWPGGHLIQHDQDLGSALAETKRWLARSPETPLFEATLRHEGVLVRVDILKGPELIEVKASTSVREYHLTDCAIQAWVVAGAGAAAPPERVHLAHIDNSFVYPGGGDYAGLFAVEGITERVQTFLPEVPEWVARCREALDGPCPEREVGPHCHAPFACPFLAHCSPPAPEYPVRLFPRGAVLAEALMAEGIFDVRDIPDDRLINGIHERVRRVTASGEAEIAPALVEFLKALPYPRFYRDFETVQFAVPIWAGTRPYEQLPFQWSCHIEPEGLVDHLGFLDTEGENPLADFIETLLEALAGKGPILVYSPFEKTLLRGLQGRFPDLSPPIEAVIERLVDLHPLLRAGYYHPAQQGSWGLKVVAPLIAPDIRYENLEGVQDGGAAQEAYRALIDPATPRERRRALGQALCAYCNLDTLALLRMVQALTGRTQSSPPGDPSSTEEGTHEYRDPERPHRTAPQTTHRVAAHQLPRSNRALVPQPRHHRGGVDPRWLAAALPPLRGRELAHERGRLAGLPCGRPGSVAPPLQGSHSTPGADRRGASPRRSGVRQPLPRP